MKKQALAALILGALMLCGPMPALADTGFYGGVSLRDGSTGATGLKVGALPLAWSAFAAPLADDSQQRTTMFGGYRWRSDIAVEAAFNASDQYALQPRIAGSAGGVGLKSVDSGLRVWNADVFTSWEFIRSLSLYGRLGYAQSDNRPLFASTLQTPGDPRRQRDGVNYGVGLRYDMTQSLGLRLEYSRFGRFAGESSPSGLLPDSDQVTIGVQFRF
ncbi:MAG TPA: outer membrane beta-barrel protein [Casimicrobiaceae bacterium]|nr:outer membrane beta-barrel protein [Casimicrobiaceae bacterium]